MFHFNTLQAVLDGDTGNVDIGRVNDAHARRFVGTAIVDDGGAGTAEGDGAGGTAFFVLNNETVAAHVEAVVTGRHQNEVAAMGVADGRSHSAGVANMDDARVLERKAIKGGGGVGEERDAESDGKKEGAKRRVHVDGCTWVA